jgi:hypothetical protein
LAKESSGRRHAWERKIDSPTYRLDVFLKRFAVQPVLYGQEPGGKVRLIANEQQTHVQLPRRRKPARAKARLRRFIPRPSFHKQYFCFLVS